MKILLLVEQCNPEWPSLPIVGFKAAREIAKSVECTIVTHIRNRENINKTDLTNNEIIYIDNEYVAKRIYNLAKIIRGNEGAWTTVQALNYPSYLAFEWEAWEKLKSRIKSSEFDLIHRVTPMSPTLPSFLSSKTSTPFILGPLNGGLKWPEEFKEEKSKEREWLSNIRDIYKILPYSKSTKKNAAAILASFDHTIDDIPKQHQSKVINFPEVGIDPHLFNNSIERKYSSKKKILFASRLVPYKLPDIVIDAFIKTASLHEHELIIVGDGPLYKSMQDKVKKHNLENTIKFTGWKTQADVSEYMKDCDIFAYPTIRELGAGALVEAMASKLTCVVVDYGAPGTLIDDDRGVKLKLADKATLTDRLAEELTALVNNDKRLKELSENAYNHVMANYTWAKKAQKTIEIYDWVLNKKMPKPDFWQ